MNIDFINSDQEARFGFNGVFLLLPKNDREKRRSQAVYIDIGSGNTKGGYFDSDRKTITTFEIEYGTKTFSEKTDRSRGNLSFTDQSKQLRDELIIPEIRKTMQIKPGLRNKPRVYLAGGISWVVAVLSHPAQEDILCPNKSDIICLNRVVT